ncbi:MAG: hypothetical protein Q9220_001128 [cf. Caloplaca sp. 1 TL-2023]
MPYPSRRAAHKYCILIQKEIQILKIGLRGLYDDARVADSLASTEQDAMTYQTDMMRSLMWRGQIQARCFRTFMQIGHISALAKPVDYTDPTPESWRMCTLLCCFPVFDKVMASGAEVAGIKQDSIDWDDFPEPLIWLSVMLTRSVSVIDDLAGEIAALGSLGEIDNERLPEFLAYNEEWEVDPGNSIPKQPWETMIGNLLPEGLNLEAPGNDIAGIEHRFHERWHRIEETYEEYFS